MSPPNNGKTTTITTQSPIIIRRAHLTEAGHIGRIAARTYKDTPLTTFLAPHRFKYYSDYERGFIERAQKRMFEPRNLTFVACEASNPNIPIGFAQFFRFGDDEGAKRQIQSSSLLWRLNIFVLGLLYGIWCRVIDWLAGGDKSVNPEAVAQFDSWSGEDFEKIWVSHEERKNRWHAQSVVVSPDFHRRQIGKRLMNEVLKRAEEDNVPVGLEASVKGEKLYNAMGFELLARFNEAQSAFEERKGGFMMWSPSGWEKKHGAI